MSFPWRNPLSRPDRLRRATWRFTGFESLEPRQLLSFDPTPMEQAFLEDINRTRLNPEGELEVYFSSLDPLVARDSEVQGAMQYFRVDRELLLEQWSELTAAPPLAWNETLTQTAHDHNLQMILADQQEHVLPGELGLGERIREAGYNFRKVTENIYAFAVNHIHGHAGFMIDWGEEPGGIQSPPGHRINILDPDVIEVGIDVMAESNSMTSVGPFLVTQDFGQPRKPGDPYILGVVWEDRNFNKIYDPGEGIKGASVVVTTPLGFTYQTTSMTAGGYQIQVPAGTYQVNVSGAGLSNPMSVPDVVVTTTNKKVDFHRNKGLRPPVAVTDTATLLATNSVVVNVLGNDFDPDGGLDPTTVTITSIPANGTVQVDRITGEITYRSADTRVPDMFFYTVRDTTGVMSNPARVNIVVSDSNQPPVVQDDLFVTRQGESVAMPVLANDTDVDNSIDTLMVQWTSLPTHGTVTGQGSELRYLPEDGYFGLQTISYRASDPSGATSNSAAVRVYVTQAGLPWRNPADPLDVDGNSIVSPLDALMIINHLGLDLAAGSLPSALANGPIPFLDVIGDNLVTPLDALLVINALGNGPQSPGGIIASVNPVPHSNEIDDQTELQEAIALPQFIPVGGVLLDRSARNRTTVRMNGQAERDAEELGDLSIRQPLPGVPSDL